MSSLRGWWLTSLVRSVTTGEVRAVASVMTLEYLTALQGLLRSIADAEELQQQAEREFQDPVAGPHVPAFQCWRTRGA